jgi:hypothetical protein
MVPCKSGYQNGKVITTKETEVQHGNIPFDVGQKRVEFQIGCLRRYGPGKEQANQQQNQSTKSLKPMT